MLVLEHCPVSTKSHNYTHQTNINSGAKGLVPKWKINFVALNILAKPVGFSYFTFFDFKIKRTELSNHLRYSRSKDLR